MMSRVEGESKGTAPTLNASGPLAHGALRALRLPMPNRLLFTSDDGIVVCVMCHVSILRCADGSLYIGRTEDLRTREAVHNEGRGARYTAIRRPVRLVYSECCRSSLDAARRELQLKRWTHAKKEALVAGHLDRLRRL